MTQAEDDLHELRTATEGLAQQVTTLSSALQMVSTLQEGQQEMVKRAEELALATREDVSENALSKHEFHIFAETREAEEAIARALTQRRLRIFAISASCVAVVIALAAVVFAFAINRSAIENQQRSRITLCQSGNAQRTHSAQLSRQYFMPKLHALERERHPDPVLVSIVTALANQEPQLANCPRR